MAIFGVQLSFILQQLKSNYTSKRKTSNKNSEFWRKMLVEKPKESLNSVTETEENFCSVRKTK